MRINTFAKENYRDCPVYFRSFSNEFEYLVIIKDELYTTHITVTPFWITKIFYMMGIEKMPYTNKHLESILKQLRKMAQTTVDYVLDKKD